MPFLRLYTCFLQHLLCFMRQFGTLNTFIYTHTHCSIHSKLRVSVSSMAALPGASTLKLYYGKPMLPDVSRVLACLYEKDVKFELIDMYEGQHMPYEFLSLQVSKWTFMLLWEHQIAWSTKLLFVDMYSSSQQKFWWLQCTSMELYLPQFLNVVSGLYKSTCHCGGRWKHFHTR